MNKVRREKGKEDLLTGEQQNTIISPCYGPQIHKLWFSSPVPQNVTLFGKRVFTEVLKFK